MAAIERGIGIRTGMILTSIRSFSFPSAPPHSAETMVTAITNRIDDAWLRRRGRPRDAARCRRETIWAEMAPEYVDPHGHPYFPSAGEGLARLLRNALGIRARVERPGSATRMSMSLVSPIDLSLAYLSGRAAVDGIIQARGGVMAAIERDASFPPGFTTRYVDLAGVANRVRSLPQAYFDHRKLAPTDAFAAYALPLLGPDPFPPYARLDRAN